MLGLRSVGSNDRGLGDLQRCGLTQLEDWHVAALGNLDQQRFVAAIAREITFQAFAQLPRFHADDIVFVEIVIRRAAKDARSNGLLANILEAAEKCVFAYIQKECAELRAITEIGSVGNPLRQFPTWIREGIRGKRGGC